ncbi:Glutaredoxin-2, mitochondrial [Intoshia linei]|uniref:Glutaredoxin-2, mitochondrial n=1 Tax=Intoshia linei TaxID=1819745 RepID=A0A177B921_9BILA|nr:Glutaredoxin-2, mitochondrial [Intoshia linei]
MACLPCIIIPFIIWLFFKFIQPLVNYIFKIKNKGRTDFVTNFEADESKTARLIKKVTEEHKIVVYKKTTCNYCSLLDKLFIQIGIPYHSVNVDQQPAYQDSLDKITGIRTVPALFINGQYYGGATNAWALFNNGKLLPLLKENKKDL